MKKPNSYCDFCQILFIILGCIFTIFEYLCKTSSNLGKMILLVGISLKLITFIDKKRQDKIFKEGIKTIGTVTKIDEEVRMTVNKEHPYVVFFSYKIDGKRYDAKSKFIWGKPNLIMDDNIEVYVDKKNFRNSAI